MSRPPPDLIRLLDNPAALSPDTGDFRSILYTVGSDGRRKWIYAQILAGAWRTRRRLVSLVLIGFYLALPFLTVGGNPFLRFDLPKRQFWILGHAFWPQDLSYLLFFVLIAIIATLLAVALAGRVFCGWGCPHNVFLEMVFRPIEAFIQGDAWSRARRDREGGNGLRRVLTWGAFALVAGVLANTATALFVGTEAFRWGLVVDPVTHPAAAGFFAVFFALIMINFAWFREQTCLVVCPYGRFQSVLLDPHSLTVGYDVRRGEPRGKPGTATGDCIDCGLCVAVCPTGVDIRNGNQLECIHCTACIDACDGIMAKLKRPPGLIRYASEVGLAGGTRRVLRPRTVLYAVLLVILGTVAVWRVTDRQPILATLLRPVGMPLFVEQDGGRWVRQAVTLSLVNRSGAAQQLTISIPAEPAARIALQHALIDLPVDARIELTPTIDLPAERLTTDQRPTLRLTSADGRTTDLAITLRRP